MMCLLAAVSLSGITFRGWIVWKQTVESIRAKELCTVSVGSFACLIGFSLPLSLLLFSGCTIWTFWQLIISVALRGRERERERGLLTKLVYLLLLLIRLAWPWDKARACHCLRLPEKASLYSKLAPSATGNEHTRTHNFGLWFSYETCQAYIPITCCRLFIWTP